MYKDFTLENLKDVQLICLNIDHQTLSMSIGKNGDGRNIINMSPGNSEDDKAIGFDSFSCMFIIRIMEQITGYRFEIGQGYHPSLRVYLRQE